jgi:hypothetical protein
MVNTCNVRNGAENSQGNGNPPPPPSLAQAIASILESRDEQTELLRQLVANFTEAGEPHEADHWLRVVESKFGLLSCIEVQKTLFAAQQLRGDASAWWANYTATRPAD